MKKFTIKIYEFLSKSPVRLIEYHKDISIFIYVTLGAIFVFEGCRTFFENPYVCPPIQVVFRGDYIMYSISIIQGMLHLILDLSATLIIVGAALLYASLNYNRSDIVDISLFAFFAITSFVHWVESLNEERIINGPFLSIIPLLLMGTIILLKTYEKYEQNDN